MALYKVIKVWYYNYNNKPRRKPKQMKGDKSVCVKCILYHLTKATSWSKNSQRNNLILFGGLTAGTTRKKEQYKRHKGSLINSTSDSALITNGNTYFVLMKSILIATDSEYKILKHCFGGACEPKLYFN